MAIRLEYVMAPETENVSLKSLDNMSSSSFFWNICVGKFRSLLVQTIMSVASSNTSLLVAKLKELLRSKNNHICWMFP